MNLYLLILFQAFQNSVKNFKYHFQFIMNMENKKIMNFYVNVKYICQITNKL